MPYPWHHQLPQWVPPPLPDNIREIIFHRDYQGAANMRKIGLHYMRTNGHRMLWNVDPDNYEAGIYNPPEHAGWLG